jgi:hypothetical protein
MIIAIMAASALFATSVPAAAPAPVSPVTVNGKHQKLDDASVAKDTMVCESEQVLGTLFKKKICATREEMADHRAVSQEELKKIQAYRPYIIDSGKLPGT